MSQNRVYRACLKAGIGAMAAAMMAWAAPGAQAGAIRYAGRMIAEGTAAAASATVAGGQVAADKVESAGQTTSSAGSAVKHALVHAGQATTNGAKNGGAAIYYGTKRAPYTVAHGQSLFGARSGNYHFIGCIVPPSIIHGASKAAPRFFCVDAALLRPSV